MLGYNIKHIYSIAILITIIIVFISIRPAGAELAYQLKGYAGAEYDTNALRVTRLEEDNIVGDWLSRLSLLGATKWLSGNRRHKLKLDYNGGGKIFFHETSENNLVNSGSASYFYRAARVFGLGGEAFVKDNILKVHDRDYTVVRSRFLLNFYLWPLARITAGAGGRYFKYKPDDFYTNHSPIVTLSIMQAFNELFALNLDTEIERRSYNGEAFQLVMPRYEEDVLVIRSGERNDRLYTFRLSAFFTGVILASTNWLLQYDDSNSVGESYLLNRVSLDLTAQIPLDIFIQWQGALQFTNYRDGLVLSQELFIGEDDENRSFMVVKISRAIWKPVHLEARYAIYANEFSQESFTFLRQIFSIGISVKYMDRLENL